MLELGNLLRNTFCNYKYELTVDTSVYSGWSLDHKLCSLEAPDFIKWRPILSAEGSYVGA
jgi:hypothetical protein